MKTADKVSGFAHEAADRVASMGSQVQEEYEERKDQFKDAEQQMVKDCRNYVRSNPVTSLGIAVAAGFVLSRLLSGR